MVSSETAGSYNSASHYSKKPYLKTHACEDTLAINGLLAAQWKTIRLNRGITAPCS
jgi:hypothetical protein